MCVFVQPSPGSEGALLGALKGGLVKAAFSLQDSEQECSPQEALPSKPAKCPSRWGVRNAGANRSRLPNSELQAWFLTWVQVPVLQNAERPKSQRNHTVIPIKSTRVGTRVWPLQPAILVL